MKGVFFLCCLSFCLITFISAKKRKYTGYQVISVQPANRRQLTFLHRMGVNNKLGVDIWDLTSSPGKKVTMSVSKNRARPLKRMLKSAGMDPVVIHKNLQNVIDKEEDDMKVHSSSFAIFASSLAFDLDNYHSHAEINTYLADVAASCKRCELITLGYSYENRHLKALKIGSLSSKSVVPRKSVWIDGGIHAREWISPATTLKFIERLVHLKQREDKATVELLDAYDWYILPVMNPDGYEYSRNTDRLWRKTRSVPSKKKGETCIGVDANRNWDFEWKKGQSKTCASTYRGPHPFSEPETLAVADFLSKEKDKYEVYLTLHSFGQFWLTPWAYTSNSLPTEYTDIKKAADAAVQAILDKSGRTYIAGAVGQIFYEAHGSSMDWALGVAGIKYSYAVELRDTGEFNFLLPPSQIEPQGAEMWSAIKAMMGVINST